MKILSLSLFFVNPAIPFFAGLAMVGPALAGDWPVLRGPDRNGISNETGFQAIDSAEVAWEKNVGLGYSAPVVADGIVVISGHNGSDKDTLYCFDESSGAEKWQHTYDQPLGDLYFQGGTTGTATIADGHVFQLAREGELFCLNAETGDVVWKKHMQQDFEYSKPDWGFTGAPLVHGEHVLINAGEAGLVLNKTDGAVVWQSENEEAGYSTPFVLNRAGKSFAIFSNKRAYVCVDLASGEEVWSHRWMTRYGVNAADPVVSGDSVLIASGYGKGAELLKWSGGSELERVWKSRDLRTQMNAAILVDGYLYGIDGDEGKDGTALKCMKFETGETVWVEESVGHGTIAVAGDQLIVLTESGKLQIAKASPDGYAPHFEKAVLGPKVWTVPVVANGTIYCRNSAGQFVALRLK